MASQKSLILREAAARQRLTSALETARSNGANIPQPDYANRNVDVKRVQELEYFADVVEMLTATAPTADAAAADPLADILTEAQLEALAEAGFDSPESISAATDEELDAVQGIGPATVTKIREALAAASE